MDTMERVLDERTEDLTRILTEVGFTHTEAERFVLEAGPAMLRSCQWQERLLGVTPMARPYAAREILSTMSGRYLASRLGVPEGKAWAGLRRFVPAVLAASRSVERQAAEAHAEAAPDDVVTFDIGFGLTLEESGHILDRGSGRTDGRQRGIGTGHPIFDRFLASHE